MSNTTYTRGLCAHTECTQAVAGCAAFVVFVNDTLREVRATRLSSSAVPPLIPVRMPCSIVSQPTNCALLAFIRGSAITSKVLNWKAGRLICAEAPARPSHAAASSRYVPSFMHVWFAPLVTYTSPLPFVRPDCSSVSQSNQEGTPNWDTSCVCGAPLRAHTIVSAVSSLP